MILKHLHSFLKSTVTWYKKYPIISLGNTFLFNKRISTKYRKFPLYRILHPTIAVSTLSIIAIKTGFIGALIGGIVLNTGSFTALAANKNWSTQADWSEFSLNSTAISSDTLQLDQSAGTGYELKNTVAASTTPPHNLLIHPDGSKIYVTGSQTTNTVRVIDTTTQAVTATIDLPYNPLDSVISPDGSKIFLTGFVNSPMGEGRVSVIDTTNNNIITTLTVGQSFSFTQLIAISPDGSKVIISHNGTSNVTILNAVTNSIISTITTGDGPTEAIFSSDGSQAFIANSWQGDHSISILDMSTNSVTGTIGTPAGIEEVDSFYPSNLTISPDNSMLSATYIDQKKVVLFNISQPTYPVLATIDPDASGINGYIDTGSDPTIFNPDSTQLYVTNNNNTISVFDTSSYTLVDTITFGYSLNFPSLVLSEDGQKLLVPGTQISLINTNNNTISNTINNASGNIGVFSPTVDYIYTLNDSLVSVIGPAGSTFSPAGIASTSFDGQSGGTTNSYFAWNTLNRSHTLNSQNIDYYAASTPSAISPIIPDLASANQITNWTNNGWTKLSFSSNPQLLSTLNASRYLHLAIYLSTSNSSVSPQVNSLALDYTPVTTTVTVPNGGETIAFSDSSSTTPISWSSTGTSGIDHFHLQYSQDSGSSWVNIAGATTISSGSTSYNWDLPDVSSTTFRIKVIAENASNQELSSSTSAADFSLTYTPIPAFSAISISSNNPVSTTARTGNTVATTFTVSKTLGSNPTVTLGGQPLSYISKSGLTYTYSRLLTGTEGSGNRTLSLSGTDSQGNTGNDTSTTFLLDFVSPTIEITSPTTNPTYTTPTTPLSVIGTASDTNLSSVTIPGGTITGSVNWTHTASLTPGSNTLTYTATDVAGNTASTTLTVTYDPPVAPTVSDLGPTQHIDGSKIGTRTPTVQFTTADNNIGNTVKFQIEFATTATFSSPLIRYTSALETPGALSFTVGQATGTGIYSLGASNQALPDSTYYWRVKAIDQDGLESAWKIAHIVP